MRLIGTLKDDRLAKAVSQILLEKKIENMVEITKNSDWSRVDYGTVACHIWIYDEDRLQEALGIFEEFSNNPTLPAASGTIAIPKSYPKVPKVKITAPVASKGLITLYFLIACTLLFFANLLTMPRLKEAPEAIPIAPLIHSPVTQALWFDYPKAWEIIDKVEAAYGIEALYKPNELPPEGKTLLQLAKRTPVFEGFYPMFIKWVQDGTPMRPKAVLFSKIREGQIWRLFTPCLLHIDLIHLFFNMIWLFVLGAQMEARLSGGRYLLFILLAGIFSNLCQYLMGGANFIGFSGVLCAMIAYVWIRQKKAPWEGYQLLPVTMGFITVFILAMFAIQVISFTLEITGRNAIPLAIANTAHLSGAFAGFVLAYCNFFSWKKKSQ